MSPREGMQEVHTATYVPGRNTSVRTAIVFIAEASRRLAIAISRVLFAIPTSTKLRTCAIPH